MDKTIYCNLLTKEDVVTFETKLITIGISNALCRPIKYASNPPEWFREGKPYDPTQDPLAAIFITRQDDKVVIDSGNRCTCGEEVSPGTMLFILGLFDKDLKVIK